MGLAARVISAYYETAMCTGWRRWSWLQNLLFTSGTWLGGRERPGLVARVEQVGIDLIYVREKWSGKVRESVLHKSTEGQGAKVSSSSLRANEVNLHQLVKNASRTERSILSAVILDRCRMLRHLLALWTLATLTLEERCRLGEWRRCLFQIGRS